MLIFSFVLRCKSTRLFFPPPRNLAQLLFFFFSSKKMVSTFHQFPTPDNTKLVEIFVFLLNLFRLEFEVEAKRTCKHWKRLSIRRSCRIFNFCWIFFFWGILLQQLSWPRHLYLEKPHLKLPYHFLVVSNQMVLSLNKWKKLFGTCAC